MMKYVIGVDLGTSSVKVLLVDQKGQVAGESTKHYPLIQAKAGYNEQNPEEWVTQTIAALQELITSHNVQADAIEGISFSGQMHGLVLLNAQHQVLRNAILWNDTRTTTECKEIEHVLGDKLLSVTRNPALEGFTLPKVLWVKKHEPELFEQATLFLLPKDYLRYRLTGQIHMEYSDAAGTLMLDVANKVWSQDVLAAFALPAGFCPPLVESHALVGTLLPDIAAQTGLKQETKVFAGGADNACGAIGSGILSPGDAMCSIGTSGVLLSYEHDENVDYQGQVHYFNHGEPDAFYSMGVTLAAGYSLSWFKDQFAPNEPISEVLEHIDRIPAGSEGLLFTPYIVGERTPHADAVIRGSFIGVDASHTRDHFARAVLEGITFSLHETLEIFRSKGKTIDHILSIGGGAKNETWLQMQADIFNARMVKLETEQGPGMGAAMLAAVGCGWFDSLKACADVFVKHAKVYEPQPEAAETYRKVFQVYQQVYAQTKGLNEQLQNFRK